MKSVRIWAAACGLILLIAAAAGAQEKPWFDLKNCAFCKQIGDQPGLLEHMNTEYHNLANGLLSITHIDSAYVPAFAKAMAGMQEVVKGMQTGKMPNMCGHCSKYGEYMMAGVKIEEVRTAYGIVNLYTAPDSTFVPKLHDFGKRSNEATEQYRKEHSAAK